LQLVRLPNLLTTPGDPLAGYLLAAGRNPAALGPAALAAITSLCLYAAGVVLNDLVDFETDLRERPSRPLPSDRITRRQATELLAALLVAAGGSLFTLGTAARVVGLALAAMVFLYNFAFKRNRFLGPIGMGACRGLSLLLGAAAAGSPNSWGAAVWAGATVLFAYIGLLTARARKETLVAGRPPLISVMIGLLLPLQALLLILSGNPSGAWVALALLALWPLNRILSKSFYSS
jgi:4-hydroxybenzoate polyprenyltransferase